MFKKYITGEDLRIRILKTIDLLKTVPFKKNDEKEKPLFVFAHIISPHLTYLFDRYGERVYYEFDYSNLESEQKFYIEEVIYLNNLIIDLIDNIIKNSNKPVIILQADHGPPGSVIRAQKERFEILNAFYFPNRDNSLLYDEISLVNTWRVILNHFFNQDFKLLEDKKYWSGVHFYDFQLFEK